ncbi:class I SAM-dependent RNA methyltransferase [Actomonas aquatica]|uniref:class I SAM-dependent RNA methyltransferase n=1 Tax=Actomonas aquatica TaxID=2866162 RepID=UPI001C7FF808
MCSVGRNKTKTRRDFPFPYHAEIELEITTLTNRGVGLGRVELASDQQSATSDQPANQESEIENPKSTWVVMVPFSLPGERVRARVFRNQKNFSEADLIEVLTPSPDRVTPRCPLFGECGGCQYQHLNYDAQLVWKRQQVEELLEHMAGLTHPVNPVIGSPEKFGYRSKITPHFNLPRDGDDASAQPIGFLRQGTRNHIIDVPECLIATDAINAHLPQIRSEVRANLAAGAYKKGATLLLRHATEGVVTSHDAIIHEQVGALKLHFLARDFFQNNPFILPAFTGYARDQAAATGARYMVDAYCGSGLFALSCASAFEKVRGIEISETSVQFATENAAANGLTNATFQAGDAAAIFAGLETDLPPADTVVLIDPPRKGCDESFLSQLFEYGPRAVVYVSCDPATQMRDLVHFKAAGYRLTAVQPFDLFPQTRHLECVVTLVKS